MIEYYALTYNHVHTHSWSNLEGLITAVFASLFKLFSPLKQLYNNSNNNMTSYDIIESQLRYIFYHFLSSIPLRHVYRLQQVIMGKTIVCQTNKMSGRGEET